MPLKPLTEQERKAYELFDKSKIMLILIGIVFSSLFGFLCYHFFRQTGFNLSYLIASIACNAFSAVMLFYFIRKDRKMKHDNLESYVAIRGLRIGLYCIILGWYCTELCLILLGIVWMLNMSRACHCCSLLGKTSINVKRALG
jgi:hypothetical protein